MADVSKTMDNAVKGLRDAVAALEAREAELQAELAGVVTQRKDAAKALQSLSGEAPRRRRGRPRGAATKPAAKAAAKAPAAVAA